MKNEVFVCDNISSQGGKLYFAGQNIEELANKYSTPLYLFDEDRLRQNIRTYKRALGSSFADARLLYASKAASFKQIYRIMAQEQVGIDVVSIGEMYTAKSAGFDLKNAYFHGNNKTDFDIAYAMDAGIGCFVCDGEEELLRINALAEQRSITQNVLLRITPGIDTHTYEAVNTGKVDSKFGSAIETGQAQALTVKALGLKHISLAGFHCHVGSQVFTEDVFERAAVIMLGFINDIRVKTGYTAPCLDLGGGYGVRYVKSDPVLDIPQKIESVAKAVKQCCLALKLAEPQILLEPGRGIVADAGMTVYTVGSVKRIPGYKNYVSVDGGMADNPRFALYGAKYTVLPVGDTDSPRELICSVVGRCCESGDIIQENVCLPDTVKRDSLIAVCTTGAYNYSMASNYNRLARPAAVMLKGGESYIAVRRESLDDLIRNDI